MVHIYVVLLATPAFNFNMDWSISGLLVQTVTQDCIYITAILLILNIMYYSFTVLSGSA